MEGMMRTSCVLCSQEQTATAAAPLFLESLSILGMLEAITNQLRDLAQVSLTRVLTLELDIPVRTAWVQLALSTLFMKLTKTWMYPMHKIRHKMRMVTLTSAEQLGDQK